MSDISASIYTSKEGKKNVRVLVVDDEPANRKLLEDLLTQDGYDTASATGGSEALKMLLLGELTFDIVLLDLFMPEVSGMDVLRKITEQNLIPQIAVIVITADSDRQTLHTALDLGAIDYVVKPFDRRELMGRLRSLARIIAINNEIKSRERRLDFVVSATDTVLCAFNQGENGEVTYVSPNVKKVLGYESSTFLKPSFSIKQILHPDDIDEYQSHIISARGLSSSVQKYRYRHGDGSWRWMWIDVHLIPRANEPGMEFVVALTDVTDALTTRTALSQAVESRTGLDGVETPHHNEIAVDDTMHNLLNLVVSFTEHLDRSRLDEQQRIVALKIIRESRDALGIDSDIEVPVPQFVATDRRSFEVSSSAKSPKVDRLWD